MGRANPFERFQTQMERATQLGRPFRFGKKDLCVNREFGDALLKQLFEVFESL